MVIGECFCGGLLLFLWGSGCALVLISAGGCGALLLMLCFMSAPGVQAHSFGCATLAHVFVVKKQAQREALILTRIFPQGLTIVNHGTFCTNYGL